MVIRITTARIGDVLPAEFLGLDVTRKSGMPTLAPPWELVRNYKAGRIDEAAYERVYRRLMEQSQVEHFVVWDGLLEEGVDGKVLCLLCYCPRGAFCHRLVLAQILRDYAQEQGHEAWIIEE